MGPVNAGLLLNLTVTSDVKSPMPDGIVPL
jgi:hypothetical protein